MASLALLAGGLALAEGVQLRAQSGATPETHRVAWLHIPKCGSSFGTTLGHYANSSLPREAKIPQQRLCNVPVEQCFTDWYPIGTYFRGLLWEKSDNNWGEHEEIKSQTYGEFKGSFFGMFRRPKERMYSSWRFFGNPPFGDHEGAQVYVNRTKGVVTKMLAGQAFGLECSWLNITCCRCRTDVVPDVGTAVARLDGFKFVGLTDHWDLSICLFHAMFGGECNQHEFENMRPTKIGGKKPANPFGDAADPYDEEVYTKVAAMFWDNVRRFGVSREACERRLCPNVTRVFALPVHPSASGISSVLTPQAGYMFDWPGRLEYDDESDAESVDPWLMVAAAG